MPVARLARVERTQFGVAFVVTMSSERGENAPTQVCFFIEQVRNVSTAAWLLDVEMTIGVQIVLGRA